MFLEQAQLKGMGRRRVEVPQNPGQQILILSTKVVIK